VLLGLFAAARLLMCQQQSLFDALLHSHVGEGKCQHFLERVVQLKGENVKRLEAQRDVT